MSTPPNAGPTPPAPNVRGDAWNGFESGLPKSWRSASPWRQTVQRRRIMLLDDLARLELKNRPEQEQRAFLIDNLLSDANIASQAKVGIRKWWWGTEIERAWARLNEVEERTVDLLPDTELPARASEALGYASAHLDGGDQRQQHLQALLADPSHLNTADLRPSIVGVLRTAHESSDRSNQEARFLRNRLILASGVCLFFAALTLLTQRLFRDNHFLTLPDDTFKDSPWQYLLLVMFFGSVGALFTAIPAMSNVPLDHSPFNLPLQQGLLKLVLGPLVAVVGLLILDADVLHVGSSNTLIGSLLLATVFGAGQHAVTRYVDQRASEILTAEAGPTKSSSAKKR
ncbi:hypothetical protein [Mycobacterium sp. E3198]|uniref:hypothetical protein n=1 Tax=Mycobacterium sp. E3198 TaxID=1834143 RepID=UPI000AA6EF39|nr:hypothetical protein [Mycobacterium sp. E3198]